MDEKELDQNEEFDLDSILNEFHSQEDGEPDAPDLETILEDLSPKEEVPEESADPEEVLPQPEEADPEAAADSAETPSEDESTPEEVPEETAPAEEASEESAPAEEAEVEDETPSEAVPEDAAEKASEESEAETAESPEEAPSQPHLHYDPQADLRELKRKLVAGPEKRYYHLTELGVGKLQLAILVNLILVFLCTVGAVYFAAGKVPESRMRFLIFSQVLAMLVSGLLGLNLITDGFGELLKGRFSINTMLSLTFLACIADGFFSLKDLRVPCCCGFCLEMVFALSARCQQRNMEMGQLDTLRKASRLHSLVRVADYKDGQPGFLRSQGRLEDFMDRYQLSSGPQKLQSFYAFFSFLLCLGIAVLAGMLHGPSMAVQILATSLLVAVPASFFIALTRPAAILERRLHMVGAVLCGWSGVKTLSGKAAFPVTDSDLFPLGSTKLNGIKFYSDRDPDMIVSYTSSLVIESGSGLIPIFNQLMTSRGVVANPVYNFRVYEGGGIGGVTLRNTTSLKMPR